MVALVTSVGMFRKMGHCQPSAKGPPTLVRHHQSLLGRTIVRAKCTMLGSRVWGHMPAHGLLMIEGVGGNASPRPS